MTPPTSAGEGRMKDKIALVSGAASGIGRACALLLAAEGAAVAVADLNDEGARSVAAEIEGLGGRAATYRLDVTAEADWTAVVDTLLAQWGRLDVAVNSAGV